LNFIACVPRTRCQQLGPNQKLTLTGPLHNLSLPQGLSCTEKN